MQKIKTMRIASILMIAVLITTCAVSGTFAKYVTTGSGNDSARVAKFGVVVGAGSSAFDYRYATEDANYTGAYSVEASDSANVVAPGTSGTGTSISITGTPEVAVRVALEFSNVTDVKLVAGTYGDPTTSDNTTDTFTLANDYYPVVYTVKYDGTTLVTGTLADLVTAGSIAIGDFDPNTDLATVSADISVEWAWAFDGAQTLNGSSFTAAQVDQADTYLGNAAAGGTFPTTGATLTTAYTATVSVTQID